LLTALVDERVRTELAAHSFDTLATEYFADRRASKIGDGIGREQPNANLSDWFGWEVDGCPAVLL
jgi:hypothetical protein